MEDASNTVKKVVLPSVKECMKNGGKIGMASIESSASIVVHVVIRVKSIPSSVGGLGRLGLIGVTLYHMPHKSGGTHDNGSLLLLPPVQVCLLLL